MDFYWVQFAGARSVRNQDVLRSPKSPQFCPFPVKFSLTISECVPGTRDRQIRGERAKLRTLWGPRYVLGKKYCTSRRLYFNISLKMSGEVSVTSTKALFSGTDPKNIVAKTELRAASKALKMQQVVDIIKITPGQKKLRLISAYR